MTIGVQLAPSHDHRSELLFGQLPTQPPYRRTDWLSESYVLPTPYRGAGAMVGDICVQLLPSHLAM